MSSGRLFVCVYLLFQFSTLHLSFSATTPCIIRNMEKGFVCVCNATYCDYLDPIFPDAHDGFIIVSSSQGGLRFTTAKGKFSKHPYNVPDWAGVYNYDDITDAPIVGFNDEFIPKHRRMLKTATISVNRGKQFQHVAGFGTALTGAVSHNLDALSPGLQDTVYKSFYGREGLGFTFMRTPIGGCDFDVTPWTYNEYPENDTLLSNFTRLDDRDLRKVNQIKRLKTVTKIDNLKISATAWSPPRWMKTRYLWSGVSALRPEYFQTWADYHLRFIELFEAQGVPIWSISTGNEPLNGVLFSFLDFMSLGWLAHSQAIWVADNLGPTIKGSKFGHVKIFGNEDQRITFPWWFISMNASRKESIDYLDGFTAHWYTDRYSSPKLIDDTIEMFPDKLMIASESCTGTVLTSKRGPALGSWNRGELYAKSFLEDFQHSFNGYIDWNMILDEQGGPNYAHNYVDASIIVNSTTYQEIYKQPMYYAMGHFSKFVPENSTRIEAVASNNNVDMVAFKRPDDRIVVVLLNSGTTTLQVTIQDSVQGNVIISVPPHSLHTVLYN